LPRGPPVTVSDLLPGTTKECAYQATGSFHVLTQLFERGVEIIGNHESASVGTSLRNAGDRWTRTRAP
jgi:hypothetical protein